ncbi:MAG TPA: NYN domain-containing protein [Ilumatobacter sp.]|nr:NYN domain-containing protein [Ilumatobacter sp.]
MSGSAADRTPETARIDPRYLRQVLLWVVDVATMGVKVKGHFPVPASLRPFLRGGRVPSVKYGALARAIESDPAFRERMAAAATEERVGAIGMAWLTRPDGWQERLIELAAAEDAAAAERTKDEELQRARKRRDAAEHAQARLQAELIELRERLAVRTGEFDAAVAEVEQLRSDATTRADELRAARAETRSASQRADAAAAKLAALRAEFEAAKGAPPEVPAAPPLTDQQQVALTDLAKASAELADRVADLKRQLVEPAGVVASVGRRARRAPLVRPGGVRSGTAEEAEFLLRAGAAVLIDGYNVAKQAWPHLDLPAQRERLVAVAEDAVRRFGADVTVVFDGADVEGASASGRRLVRVRYSPAGVIADDIIRAEVAEVPVSKPVVVVTDDKEILRDVRNEGANTIASALFVAVVG